MTNILMQISSLYVVINKIDVVQSGSERQV